MKVRRTLTYAFLFLLVAGGGIALGSYVISQYEVSPRDRQRPVELEDGVALVRHGAGVVVRYANGAYGAAGGYGVISLAWEDYQANKDRLRNLVRPGETADAVLTADDFPVVAFFNAAGFDATFEAAKVCRARDGAVVAVGRSQPADRVLAAVPRRAGGFTLVFPDKAVDVPADAFDRDFIRLPPLAPGALLLTPEQAARLTDDELKRLGFSRTPPPADPKAPAAGGPAVPQDRLTVPKE